MRVADCLLGGIAVCAAALLCSAGSLRAAGPAKVTDPQDRQVLEAFLGHVDKLPQRLSRDSCVKLAADEPEGYCWVIVPQLRMALTAWRLTGDPKHLDLFASLVANMRAALTNAPDGYLGWYGKPLELFRDPKRPQHKTDVIITSYTVAEALCEFLEEVAAEPKLAEKHAGLRREWLDLIENHLVAKWEKRGCAVDLGRGGVAFRTPLGLAPTKAHLTQPANKHSKICRAYLALYRVTGKDAYMRMAVKVGTRFKRTLTLRDGHYEWNYWDPAGAWDIHPDKPKQWKHWIGVGHRGGYYSLSAQTAVALYHHGVVFDREDLGRFLKTQTAVCWNGDVDKPVWSRVDGTRHEKYMSGAYVCGALTPFDEPLAKLLYGPAAQRERLNGKDHPWRGGTVAAGWLEGKYVDLPKARAGGPIHAEFGRRFLADKGNRAFHDALSFRVVEPGYRAPGTPAEMRPMPKE